MAIRINNGTVPRAGRLTMPKGTFLSNPSTAPDGGLGESGAMLPPTPQVNMWQGTTPGYNTQLTSNNQVTNSSNPFVNPYGVNLNQFSQYQHQPTLLGDLQDWFRGEGRYASNPDPLLRSILMPSSDPQKSIFAAKQQQNNALVGQDISSSPEFISNHQAVSALGYSDPERVAQFMQSKGYQSQYESGVGYVWVKVAESAPSQQLSAAQGGLDSRGRPEYVDPTLLDVGERMTSQSGVTFVGGQDYTDAGGNTSSQYAMTLPDNVGSDPKGRYKWKSTVKKDSNGNWVRVYRRELRKVHTRSHRKKVAAREENQQQASQNDTQFNQLVNLRVNFG